MNTFDDWWKTNSINFTNKYLGVSLYDIAHSAYEFGLHVMLERKQKEIEKLEDTLKEALEYKYMYEELCK